MDVTTKLLIINTCESFFRCTPFTRYYATLDARAEQAWEEFLPYWKGRKHGRSIYALHMQVRGILQKSKGDSADRCIGDHVSPLERKHREKRWSVYSGV